MIGKKRVGNYIRSLALLLVLSMLLGILPAGVGYADENDTMGTVISEYVRSNLLRAGGSSDAVNKITNDKIEGYFRNAHAAGTDWSSTSLVSTIQAAANEAAMPWTLENGTDYSGQPINANYSMGDLLVAYFREKVAAAAALSDAQIIQLYNGLTEGSNPFVKVSDITKEINRAGQSSVGSYSDHNFNSLIKTDGMVTFRDYTIGQNHVIKKGTLFIGTYLIDMSVLNDIFYRYAVESITSMGQNVRLYKSELDGGRWKDIDSASGLYDIMPRADTIPESELMNYNVSCVIGEDGIPRSAKDGSEINIFEMSNPYELDTMSEFSAVKIQVDGELISETSEDPSTRFTAKIINSFFKCDQPDVGELYPRDAINLVNEINSKNMLFFNVIPSTHADSGTSGFRWMLTEWALSDRPHRFTLTTKRYSVGRWMPAYYVLFLKEIPIIAGGVSWSDEVWFANRYSSGSGGKEMNAEFNDAVAKFEQWYSHYSNTRDPITEEADTRITNLQKMYVPMRQAGNADGADTLMTLMSKIDSTRRAEVYYNLVQNEDNRGVLGPLLPYVIKALETGKGDYGFDFSREMPNTEFKADSGITDAMQEALASCQTAYVKHLSNSLIKGTTVLSEREYKVSMNVVETADNSSDYRQIEDDLKTLSYIYNIQKSAVINAGEERALIEELLPIAEERYVEKLHANVNADYKQAEAEQSEVNVLEGILKEQKAGVTGIGSQLQQLIMAECLRLNEAEGIAFINNRIDWAEGQRDGITTDAFGKYAIQALEQHIQWLEDILSKVKNGTLLNNNDEEELTEKEQYLAAMLSALENNDFAAATAAEESAKAVDASGNGSGNGTGTGDDGTGNTNNDNTGTEKTGAAGNNGTKDPKLIALEREVIGELDGENTEGLIDKIAALGELGSDRLAEIKKLLPADSGEDLVKAVDQAIETAKTTELKKGTSGTGTGTGAGTGTGSGTGAGTGTGTGTGSGTGTGTGTGTGAGTGTGTGTGTGAGTGIGTGTGTGDGQRDAINNLIESMFGAPFADLPDDEKIAVIAGCMRYGKENSNEFVCDFARELTKEVVDEKNVFIYHQFTADPTAEYVSLAAVDRARRYTRYRYVRIGNEITMTQILDGSVSYVFTIGSNEVEKASGQKEQMSGAAVQQKDPYLRGELITKYGYLLEDDAYKYLEDKAEYIDNTEWAAVITPSIDTKAEDFRGKLREIFK